MFVSVIVNVGSWLAIGASVIEHTADHVRMKLISQLINGISKVLLKLLKYFNGTLFLTLFAPLSPIFPAIFCAKFKRSTVV